MLPHKTEIPQVAYAARPAVGGPCFNPRENQLHRRSRRAAAQFAGVSVRYQFIDRGETNEYIDST